MDIKSKKCAKCDSVKDWTYSNGKYNAQGYAKTLMKPESLGCPQECGKGYVSWNNPAMNLIQVTVRDENVRHESIDNGKVHMDYVYSHTVINSINRIHIRILSEIMNNIKVDLKKKEVVVRCTSVLDNQVILGFIDDLSNNRLDYNIFKLKHEYKMRTRHQTTNANYPDILKERKQWDIQWDLRTRL